MRPLYENHPASGPKSEIEDAMYPMYSHCVYNLNPRACSIDTPLHTLVPFKHVDHLHPNSVIAIAASVNQERLTKDIYGDDVIYIPWQRPGFDIGLKIEQLINDNPNAKGILLGHHGMSSWDNDDKTCYETALEIIDRAAQYIEGHDKGEATFGGPKYKPLDDATREAFQTEIIPFVRGRVSENRRFVGTVQDDVPDTTVVLRQDELGHGATLVGGAGGGGGPRRQHHLGHRLRGRSGERAARAVGAVDLAARVDDPEQPEHAGGEH